MFAVDLADVEFTDRMRIGVLPGSFSPVHLRHQEIAENVLEYANLDYIVILANDFTPHKPSVLDIEHRVNMLYEAFKHHPQIIVIRKASDFKFPRIRNVVEYIKHQSDVHIAGVSGYDSITSFMSRFGIGMHAGRSFNLRGENTRLYDSWAATYKQGEDPRMIPELMKDLVVQKVYVPTEADPHSSDIRKYFQRKKGRKISSDKLPLSKRVFKYIQKNKLYQSVEPSKLKAYCKWAFTVVK